MANPYFETTYILCIINLSFAFADHDEFLPTVNASSENGHVHVTANNSGKESVGVSTFAMYSDLQFKI